jgi:hypothetical protein
MGVPEPAKPVALLPEDARVRCPRCRADMDARASFCTSCNKYTDWREPIAQVGSIAGTVAAIVALFVALNLKQLVRDDRSDVRVLARSCDREGADLTAVNIGQGTAILTQGSIRQYIVDKRLLDPATAVLQSSDERFLERIDRLMRDSADATPAGFEGDAVLPITLSMGRGSNDLPATSVALETDQVSSVRIRTAQFADTDPIEDGIQPGDTPRMVRLKSMDELIAIYDAAMAPTADGVAPSPACIAHVRFRLVDAETSRDTNRYSRLEFTCSCPE